MKLLFGLFLLWASQLFAADCPSLDRVFPDEAVDCASQSSCEPTAADRAYLAGRCAATVADQLAGYQEALTQNPWHFAAQLSIAQALAELPEQKETVAGLYSIMLESPSTPEPVLHWLRMQGIQKTPEASASPSEAILWMPSVWAGFGYDSNPVLSARPVKGSTTADFGGVLAGVVPLAEDRLMLSLLVTQSTNLAMTPGVTRDTELFYGSLDYLMGASAEVRPGITVARMGLLLDGARSLTQTSVQPRLEVGAATVQLTTLERRLADNSEAFGRGVGFTYSADLGAAHTLAAQVSWLTLDYAGPQEGRAKDVMASWIYTHKFDSGLQAQLAVRDTKHTRGASGLFPLGEQTELRQLELRLNQLFGVAGLQAWATISRQTAAAAEQEYRRTQTGLQYTVNW